MRYKIKRIENDASFREFYRLISGKKKSILILSKKEKFKNLIVYSIINKFLNKHGIKAPKMLSQNFADGYAEIQDFGKVSIKDKIKNSKNKFFHYRKCVDIILKMQKIKMPNKVRISNSKNFIFDRYNLKNLNKESDLFFNWYLKGVLGKKYSEKNKNEIKKELNSLYKKIYFTNKYFVHRDFHVSNIMCIKKKLGVIDTQDALIGNPAYDLVSLIDDIRLVMPDDIKNKVLNYYLKKNPKFKNKENSFKNDFKILSVQRNLKILGIFYRLYKRDNKSKYLKYLPFVWNIIEKRIKDKIFDKLRVKLYSSINIKIRRRIFRYEK